MGRQVQGSATRENDLPAVSVPGELQEEARCLGAGIGKVRFVGKQDGFLPIRQRVQDRGEIRFTHHEIVQPGDIQSLTASLHRVDLVFQDTRSAARQAIAHKLQVCPMVVVPQRSQDSIRGSQAAYGGAQVAGKLLRRICDVVAGNGD